MTEARLFELRKAADVKDGSFDSSVVRELLAEFDRLRGLIDEPDRIRSQLKQQIAELSESNDELGAQLSAMEQEISANTEKSGRQEKRLDTVAKSIVLCLDQIRNPQTVEFIRTSLKDADSTS